MPLGYLAVALVQSHFIRSEGAMYLLSCRFAQADFNMKFETETEPVYEVCMRQFGVYALGYTHDVLCYLTHIY